MKIIPIVFAFAFLLSGCSTNKKPDRKLIQSASQYFNEVERITSSSDDIWNFDLSGPILFSDPTSKFVVANVKSPSFNKTEDVYFGVLPEDVLPANKLLKWEGKQWNMFTLPLPEDSLVRQHQLLVQLFKNNEFHLGLNQLHTPDCIHLTQSENRVWMKIEAEALKEALNTNDLMVVKDHIKMALAAHRIRKVMSDQYFARENNFYLKQGLPELNWYLMNHQDYKTNCNSITQKLNQLQNSDHFTQSFAQAILPAYGYIMSQESTKWVQTINEKTDITELIENFYKFKYDMDFMQIMAHLKARYKGAEFENEERIRNERNKQTIAKYEELFLNSPFIMIKIDKSTSLNYDVNKLIPFLDKGTIYQGIIASGSWGTVTVTKGALINSQRSYLYLTTPYSKEGQVIKGPDWEMKLNPGYNIIPYQNTDKFIVAKQ